MVFLMTRNVFPPSCESEPRTFSHNTTFGFASRMARANSKNNVSLTSTNPPLFPAWLMSRRHICRVHSALCDLISLVPFQVPSRPPPQRVLYMCTHSLALSSTPYPNESLSSPILLGVRKVIRIEILST